MYRTKSLTHRWSSLLAATVLAFFAGSLLAADAIADGDSQQMHGDPSKHAGPAGHSGHHAGPAGCPMMAGKAGKQPRQVGQSAFAALAEMTALLDGDPATDWSKVDLDRLREHLVDMEQVSTEAAVVTRSVPMGFEAEISGSGRTLAAIRRMVPAHARHMNGQGGLTVAVKELETGVLVVVTTADPARVDRLRGLGFFGFLTAGDHHRPHHLAMALGAGHP